MSGLRRSRPDEQDASLKRLQKISITRHEADTGAKSPHRLSPRSPKAIGMCMVEPHVVQKVVSDDENEVHFFPPVLMVSDLPSSAAVHQFEKDLNLNASSVSGQISPVSLSKSPGTTDRFPKNQTYKHKSRSLSPGHGLSTITKQGTANSGNTGLLSINAPHIPKDRTVSETDGKSKHGKPLSSPSSPSIMLKQCKLLDTSRFDFSKRRGSEPVLDSFGEREIKKVQFGVTDRRWEKLRSILVAMKNEPVDFKLLDSFPSDNLDNLQDKIDTQEEVNCLNREISDLHVILRQKESSITQLELERDAAISYIEKLKLPTSSCLKEKSITDHYIEQGIQGLRAQNVSKEEVIEVTSHLLKEVTSQKAYLERLISLVLTHAPWLLDDMDRSQSASVDGEDDDYIGNLNDSDDEVWC
ncbi:hypothetical protein PoB_005175500 [Plakobranchus ocellatus]|uniref:Uncharacterized protein n=1 Tax=Plakobranchus ocellatus TaxID=259542 RepID=A0AAV4C0W4_9GAST|nr:hypothetical protein PoB_005175500 [Plakobranchus ocellatus]